MMNKSLLGVSVLVLCKAMISYFIALLSNLILLTIKTSIPRYI